MIKSLLVIASLFFSLNTISAQQVTCGTTTQGGFDNFPWSQAQPFPWTKIQGLWKVPGNNDLVIKLKVIRQTARVKQLEAEIYSKSESCLEPKMKGVGLITSFEKNVVRINLDSKLIKLAVFNSADLEMNADACGAQVMAISMIDLVSDTALRLGTSDTQYESQNMVLKKITSSIDLYCKKRN